MRDEWKFRAGCIEQITLDIYVYGQIEFLRRKHEECHELTYISSLKESDVVLKNYVFINRYWIYYIYIRFSGPSRSLFLIILSLTPWRSRLEIWEFTANLTPFSIFSNVNFNEIISNQLKIYSNVTIIRKCWFIKHFEDHFKSMRKLDHIKSKWCTIWEKSEILKSTNAFTFLFCFWQQKINCSHIKEDLQHLITPSTINKKIFFNTFLFLVRFQQLKINCSQF